MGQRIMRHPPKWVHGFLDRHQKPRFYFRRPGFKRVALPGLPWSPEFMSAYEEALAGQPASVGAARTIPGSMRALAVSYYNGAAFRALCARTQYERRGIIDRFCREHGDKRLATLQRHHIVKLIAARAAQPGAANNLRKALRELMKHAVEIGLRSDDPTRDVKRISVNSDGHHSWTEDEITRFEAGHPVGSRQRLAFALLLYTGQRRGDVIRMGRQHLREGMLSVRQEKTNAVLDIPVHAALMQAIDAISREHLTFLTTNRGEPFSPTAFSAWFRRACDAAGLPHCSAHGLRKAAARRLAEAGCTANEIAAITGHASLREVARYTRAADQRRLAAAAMAKVSKA
jgi:integrase